jgi:Reverse transcriptase (RNA-dependent DNA polymerase)
MILLQKNKYLRYELDQSPFYCLRSQAKLAKLLWVGRDKLKSLTQSDYLFDCEENISTDSGKIRLLEKPRPDLKRVQKQIEDILKRIKCPNYLHNPKKGCSYISNAKVHVNANVVRILDIEKYFLSTPARRVYWFFHKKMKCSPDVAGILTKLLTFKDHLPTGSPSSPLLSYFAHMDMWEAINEIVERENCNLSVYMDDINISGDHVSDRLIWEVKKQLYRHGLRSNNKKEKHYAGNQSRRITGVIITSKGELKVPNRQHLKMHKIRKLLYSADKPEVQKKLIQRLKGMEAQAKQISDANSIAR